MSLLGDHQTGSYWDHITGECVHGPLKGRKLTLEPLLHMRADQALAQFPDARIASSRSLLPFGLVARIMDLYGRLLGQGRFVPPMLLSTMGAEDPRRARMDLGLGVWTDGASRYYPLEILKARGGVLFDRFDGREMLIYLDSYLGHADAPFRGRSRGRVGGRGAAPGQRRGHPQRQTLRRKRRRVAGRTAAAPFQPLVRVFVDVSKMRGLWDGSG